MVLQNLQQNSNTSFAVITVGRVYRPQTLTFQHLANTDIKHLLQTFSKHFKHSQPLNYSKNDLSLYLHAFEDASATPLSSNFFCKST